MQNYFKGTKEKPYHLSIGAVLLNDENKVCCHYFDELDEKSKRVYGDLKDFYILMRETPELGESIEQTLNRGIMEEFGATGEVITYLGSINGEFTKGGVNIEKTTLYFLMKLKSFNPDLRSLSDIEGDSEIQWQTPAFLIEKMRGQRKRLNQTTLDESVILERVK